MLGLSHVRSTPRKLSYTMQFISQSETLVDLGAPMVVVVVVVVVQKVSRQEKVSES